MSTTRKMLTGFALLGAIVCLAFSAGKTFRELQMRRTVKRAAGFVKALEQYHQKTGRYPESPEVPIARIMATSFGSTVSSLNASDGWGRSFRYMSSGDSYVLWSVGRNGVTDRMPGGGEFENYDFDLIAVSGDVWQGPSGFF